MPQMAPMNWLFLYIFFFIIFLLFNFMNYYLFLIKKNIKNINEYSTNKINWKW